MEILKINGNAIKTYFDCNAEWLTRQTHKIKFSEHQEEIKIRNILISQKIAEDYFMEGLEFKGDENPLLIIKNEEMLKDINIEQHLIKDDQVIHGTRYLTKNIYIDDNQLVRFQERVDMLVNSYNKNSKEMEIKAFTFYYGDAKVEKNLTFKDMIQYILLKDEYGENATIKLHRVNLKNGDTYIQILKSKDFMSAILPTIKKMSNTLKNNFAKPELQEKCKICPYYDYCGIKNVERVNTNIVDRILTLETELRQAKMLGRKWCEIHEGLIKGSNGELFGIKPERSKSFAGYKGKKDIFIKDIIKNAEPEDIMDMFENLKDYITFKNDENVLNYLNNQMDNNFSLIENISYKFKKYTLEEDE